METNTKKQARYFNTPIMYSQEFENIDMEKGILKGVHVCCEGEAKGHGIKLDKDFIRDVTTLGNGQPLGVKSRFGHPNMSNTALGTYVGRFHNFRNNYIDRDGVKSLASLADLHLDEAAKKSPNGDLHDYTLSLAQSSPDMFGSSIAYMQGASKFKNEKTGATDENGKDIFKEVEYGTIKSLLATDLVDDGAATDKIFSSNSFAEQVTQYLDSNPEIYEILMKQPEIVDNFLNNYKTYKVNAEKLSLIKNEVNMSEKENEIKKDDKVIEEKSLKEKIMDIVGLSTEVKDISEETKTDYDNQIIVLNKAVQDAKANSDKLTTDLQTANTELETIKAELITLKAEKEALKTEKDTFKTENDRLTTENTKILAGEIIPKNDQDLSNIGELSDHDKELQADVKKLADTAEGK